MENKFKEIERKFLVRDGYFLEYSDAISITQIYLSVGNPSVRVRSSEHPCGRTEYTLTIKGKGDVEVEFNIKKEEFNVLRETSEYSEISKHRWKILYAGFIFEVDHFWTGVLKDTKICEVELDDWDTSFKKPPWLGKEVTSDPSYSNKNMISKL